MPARTREAGSFAAAAFARVWRQTRAGWPFVLLAVAVLPLLWMAIAGAVRAGLFSLSGEPGPDQLGAFLTFIGTSLGTIATVFAALLTRAHNARERQRLRLDTVIKSLETLPDTEKAEKARLAGVLSTMVLLGQERIAMRVLHPAWEQGMVDDATATWLLGQVLTSRRAGNATDGDRVDEAAVREAAVLLARRGKRLTHDEAGQYDFVGHYMQRWRTRNRLPVDAKLDVLLAMAKMLVGRDNGWWSPAGGLPAWPTIVFVECAEREPNQEVRNSSAVVLAALRDCFPEEFEERIQSRRIRSILAQVDNAPPPVREEYREIAKAIRNDWRRLSAGTELDSALRAR